MAKFKKIWVDNNYRKNKYQTKICFRSKWEILFAKFLDNNENVKSWRQDYPFKYYDQYVSKKISIYYIDFYVIMKDGLNVLIEVKPIKTLNETVRSRSIKFKKIHNHNYLKNISKFESVETYCRVHKWKFFLVDKSGTGFKFYNWDIKHRKAVLVKNKSKNNK